MGEYSFAAEFEASLPKKRQWPLGSKEHENGAVQEGIMGVVVSTQPPLGQVTQVSRSSQGMEVYALLETKRDSVSSSGCGWDVHLWYGSSQADGSQWAEEPMVLLTEEEQQRRIWPLQGETWKSVERRYFRATVRWNEQPTDAVPLSFTVKFREQTTGTEDQTWRWVHDETGVEDGILLVGEQTSAGASSAYPFPAPGEAPGETPAASERVQPDCKRELSDLIPHLNGAFSVTSKMSQVLDTQLWSLEATAGKSENDVSTYTNHVIGVPFGGFLRWVALVRIWTPWLAPRQGQAHLELDRDAMMCSFLGPAGLHLVFLAVSGVRHLQSVFQSDAAGRLTLQVRSDSLEDEKAMVLVAVGNDFERANAAVIYHARSVVQPWRQQQQEQESVAAEMQRLGNEVEPQSWLEAWYDGLGYCTWNGLGQQLTEAKVLQAMDTLAEQGVRVASLIIDDNWQALDRRGHGGEDGEKKDPGQFQYSWLDFEADAEAFPNGLGHVIREVRKRHRHVRHIAVWHALLGYWGGISPDGPLAQRYATTTIEREHPLRRNLPVAGPMTVVANYGAGQEDEVRRLYEDFYTFLAASGVDSAKTDAQFMMDAWSSARARRELTPAYLDAWAVATLRHLQARAISCMSQTPSILFYAQLGNGSGSTSSLPALPTRNSDDFFPDVPSSHAWHVWANACNSLLTQHLNVLPDWDMFQTEHAYSGFHAAARCVSGGPIYITDVPGQHNKALIDQIAGPSVPVGGDGEAHGHAVVFRPSIVGRSLDPYVGFRDRVLLKVGAFHAGSGAGNGTGMLGLFNVSDEPLTELVPLAKIPSVVFSSSSSSSSSSSYIARAHSTGRVVAGSEAAFVPVSLDVRGHEIISAYVPYVVPWKRADKTDDGDLLVANLGLVRKMAAAASVVYTKIKVSSSSSSPSSAATTHVELTAGFKALGVVGFYVSRLSRQQLTVEDNMLATLRGLPIPAHCASLSRQDPCVLELDMERAWTDMGLKGGWNNEVDLTLLIKY